MSIPKKLPSFFSQVYEIGENHLQFFKEQEFKAPLNLGKVRSGSRVLDIEVKVDALEVLKHHILIPAATGRGKSNLVKTLLYDLLDNDKCGKLVFDPHNEYYGSITQNGLRDHPKSPEFLEYYTIRNAPGANDLKFNMNLINPAHIIGSIKLTDAQKQAIVVFYRSDRKNWIQNLYKDHTEADLKVIGIKLVTVEVLRRKLGLLLNITLKDDGTLDEKGIYTASGNEQTTYAIYNSLSKGKTVIIDTSLLEGAEEIFIASIIVEKIFKEYKKLKFDDKLKDKPVI